MGVTTHGWATTAGGSAVRLLSYPAGERHPFHAHDRSSITLILGGSLEEQVGSELERASALSVVVKPAGVPHADRFGAQGATTLQIELSPEDEAGARSAGPLLESWRWIHATEAVRPMLGLLRCLRDRSGAGTQISDLLAETLAALDPPTPRSEAGPPAWLTRARDALSAQSVPIRVLAAEARVHPVHLAREFRRHFGIAPTRYRCRMRIWRAAALLSQPADSLASVALEAGFADQAHMTHGFRSETGVTPRTMRRLAGSATPIH